MHNFRVRIFVVLAVLMLLFVSVLVMFSYGAGSNGTSTGFRNSLAPPAPLSSSDFSPSPDYGYVANGNNNVTVINLTDNSIVGNISTVLDPSSVEVTPNGTYLLAVSSSGNGIGVIDLNNLKTLAVMPTYGKPGSLSIAPDGKYAYLSILDSQYIYAYSLTSLSSSGSNAVPIQVAYNPGHMTFSINGTMAYVTSMSAQGGGISHNFTVLNTLTNKVVAIISSPDLSNPVMSIVTPNGSELYVANNASIYITEFSLSNYSVVKQLVAAENPQWLMIDPANNYLYYLFDSYNNLAANVSLAYFSPGTSFSMGTSVSQKGHAFNASLADGGKIAYIEVKNPDEVVVFNLQNQTAVDTISLKSAPGQMAIPETAYYGTLTLNETGVPANADWSVTFGGLTYTTNNSSMNVFQYYGTYTYSTSYVNFSEWYDMPAEITVGFDSPAVELHSRSSVTHGYYPNYGYLANGYNLTVFSPQNGSVIGFLDSVQDPVFEAPSPNGSFLYAANVSNHNTTITEVNLKTMSVSGRLFIPGQSDVSSFAINPDGKYLYLSSYTSYNLTVISLSTFKVVKEMNVTFASGSVAFTPNGSLGFSFSENPVNYRELSHNMTVFNAYTNTVIKNISSLMLQDPFQGQVSPNGSLLLISNYDSMNVTAFNVSSMKFIKNISLPGYPDYLTFSRDGSSAYILDSNHHTNITILNADKLQITNNVPYNQPYASSIAIAPNGTYAYFTGNTLFGLNLNTYKMNPLLANEYFPYQVLIPSTYYATSLRVEESGLPHSASWSFTIGNETFTSSGTNLTAYSYFGENFYSSSGSSGFTALDNGSGTIAVNATTGVIHVNFAVPVKFNESGLPNGTLWYLNISGMSSYGPYSGNSVTVDLPSGNYTVTVASPGYRNDSFNISVTKNGEHYQAALVKNSPNNPGQPGLSTGDLLIVAGSVAGAVVIASTLLLYFRRKNKP